MRNDTMAALKDASNNRNDSFNFDSWDDMIVTDDEDGGDDNGGILIVPPCGGGRVDEPKEDVSLSLPDSIPSTIQSIPNRLLLLLKDDDTNDDTVNDNEEKEDQVNNLLDSISLFTEANDHDSQVAVNKKARMIACFILVAAIFSVFTSGYLLLERRVIKLKSKDLERQVLAIRQQEKIIAQQAKQTEQLRQEIEKLKQQQQMQQLQQQEKYLAAIQEQDEIIVGQTYKTQQLEPEIEKLQRQQFKQQNQQENGHVIAARQHEEIIAKQSKKMQQLEQELATLREKQKQDQQRRQQGRQNEAIINQQLIEIQKLEKEQKTEMKQEKRRKQQDSEQQSRNGQSRRNSKPNDSQNRYDKQDEFNFSQWKADFKTFFDSARSAVSNCASTSKVQFKKFGKKVQKTHRKLCEDVAKDFESAKQKFQNEYTASAKAWYNRVLENNKDLFQTVQQPEVRDLTKSVLSAVALGTVTAAAVSAAESIWRSKDVEDE